MTTSMAERGRQFLWPATRRVAPQRATPFLSAARPSLTQRLTLV